MKLLVQINKVSKNYGSQELFDTVSFSIFEKQKIGVIGRNGAGKTTLCKFLTGEEDPSSGSIDKSPDCRLSYLQQSDPYDLEETAAEFLVRHTGKEEWLCGKTAAMFKIKNEMYEGMKIGELSGGFRTRVKLTAMLLNDPNIIVLDEPTNFLDLSTQLLLENFLQNYKGGFLVVSHDREFLKKTCDHTLEIENANVTMFPGDVEQYFEYKYAKKEIDRRFNKNIDQRKKELESFITRFKAKNTKATQAKSKMKQLGKLHTIEIEHPMSSVKINIQPVDDNRKGYALNCRDMVIGYPEHDVADDVNFEIARGTHTAVLGDNGQGKTTLLRTIAGDLESKAGEFSWGFGLDTGYYAQHVYTGIRENEDVYTYLQRNAHPTYLKQDLLDMAGSFLFRGDDVLKPLKVLSGGERSRLCLAGLLLSKMNVLILDEPTNHLDFETVEALGRALRKYNGTVIFVSHDRTFVSLVADRILYIQDGKVQYYAGTYQEYVYKRQKDILDVEEMIVASSDKKEKSDSDNKTKYLERKRLNTDINRIKKKIAVLEKNIRKSEDEKTALEKEFSDHPELYSDDKANRLQELLTILSDYEINWLELDEELSSLQTELEEYL